MNDSNSRTFAIGIDGGGTSTKLLLARIDGQDILTLGQQQSGPTNAIGQSTVEVQAELTRGIAALCEKFDVAPDSIGWIGMGMAGVGSPTIRRTWMEWLHTEYPLARSWLGTDLELVLGPPGNTNSTDTDHGVLGLISGTGSIAAIRFADGKTQRAGGWGPLLGDEGSGYWIGLEALRRCCKAFDRGQVDCRLGNEMLSELGIESWRELPRSLATAPREMIAGLSRRVHDAASRGESLASDVVNDAAEELVALTLVLLEQAKNLSFEVRLAGGTLVHGSELRRCYIEKLKKSSTQPLSFEIVTAQSEKAIRMALAEPNNE